MVVVVVVQTSQLAQVHNQPMGLAALEAMELHLLSLDLQLPMLAVVVAVVVLLVGEGGLAVVEMGLPEAMLLGQAEPITLVAVVVAEAGMEPLAVTQMAVLEAQAS